MGRMPTLGIAGTAKNTGKTTALSALLSQAEVRGVPVAVTSIGYDGEAVDNVTGLPKPRIVVPPGTVVTTARSCLAGGGAGVRGAWAPRWEVLEEAGIATPLGELIVARAHEGGAVVLAGPNKRHELAAVLERMEALGPGMILVDGALNRLAPMSVASGLILATGAARTPDLSRLVAETAAVEALLALPTVSRATRPGSDAERRVGGSHGEMVIRVPFPTVGDVGETLGRGGGGTELGFEGPVTPEVLAGLVMDARVRGRVRVLVFPDPIMLLLSGDVVAMAGAVEGCRRGGLAVEVSRPLPLAAVTVNPFLPRYGVTGYVADAVPAAELRDAMRAALRAPVIDVVLDGPGALWRTVSGDR